MDKRKRDAVAARLERIRLNHDGVLTPDDVVKDARRDSSPLHDQFEWDDTVAAGKYRIEQARELIRTVTFTVTTTTDVIQVPYYIRDTSRDAKEQGYTAVNEIKTKSEVAYDALRYEFSRAIAVLERANNIADAIGLGDELKQLVVRVRVIRDSFAQVAAKT